jgi:hypothetical protein
MEPTFTTKKMKRQFTIWMKYKLTSVLRSRMAAQGSTPATACAQMPHHGLVEVENLQVCSADVSSHLYSAPLSTACLFGLVCGLRDCLS